MEHKAKMLCEDQYCDRERPIVMPRPVYRDPFPYSVNMPGRNRFRADAKTVAAFRGLNIKDFVDHKTTKRRNKAAKKSSKKPTKRKRLVKVADAERAARRRAERAASKGVERVVKSVEVDLPDSYIASAKGTVRPAKPAKVLRTEKNDGCSSILCKYSINSLKDYRDFISANDVSARKKGVDRKRTIDPDVFVESLLRINVCVRKTRAEWCNGKRLTAEEQKSLAAKTATALKDDVKAEKVADAAGDEVAKTAADLYVASQKTENAVAAAAQIDNSADRKKADAKVRAAKAREADILKVMDKVVQDYQVKESVTARAANEATEENSLSDTASWFKELLEDKYGDKAGAGHPSLSLPHDEYRAAINKRFKQFGWDPPRMEDACAKAAAEFKKLKSEGKPAFFPLTQTQMFMKAYLTPQAPVKGVILATSTGGGKTCTGVAVGENFKRVLWVTRPSMRSGTGIERAMLNDFCSGTLKDLSAAHKKKTIDANFRVPVWSDESREKTEPMEPSPAHMEAAAKVTAKVKSAKKAKGPAKTKSERPSTDSSLGREVKRVLDRAGTQWITPPTAMSWSYKQFANYASGKTSSMGKELQKNWVFDKEAGKMVKAPNLPLKDHFKDTLIVIDEPHLLYEDELPLTERPTQKERDNILKLVHAHPTCKLLLMTATPADNIHTLFSLANLLIPDAKKRLPVNTVTTVGTGDRKKDKITVTVNKKMLDAKMCDINGDLTKAGVERIQDATRGRISYLNLLGDPSRFAQLRKTTIPVIMTDVQAQEISTACLGNPGLTKSGEPSKAKRKEKSKKYAGTCIRLRAAYGAGSLKGVQFDHKDYDAKTAREMIAKVSPKMTALLANIAKLDAQDVARHKKLYKHVIFSDLARGFGEKLIVSALVSNDNGMRYRSVVKKEKGEKISMDLGGSKIDPTNVGVMTTSPLYGVDPKKRNHGTGKKKKSFNDILIETFNDRDENVHGENIRILVLGRQYSVGLDAFDVKYLHIMEEQLTLANTMQVEGRGTRMCGQKKLAFDKKEGWLLNVFNYKTDWKTGAPGVPPRTSSASPAETAKLLFLEATQGKIGMSVVAGANLTNVVRNLAFDSAVDGGLNVAINGMNVLVDMDIDAGNSSPTIKGMKPNMTITTAMITEPSERGEKALSNPRNTGRFVLNLLHGLKDLSIRKLMARRFPEANKAAIHAAVVAYGPLAVKDPMDIKMLIAKIANDPEQTKMQGKRALLGSDYRRALELIGMYA